MVLLAISLGVYPIFRHTLLVLKLLVFGDPPHFEIPPTIPENCKTSSGTQDAKSVCNSNVETRRQVFLRKPLRHQSVIEEIPEVIKTPKSAGILEIPGMSAVIFRTSRLVGDPGNSKWRTS